MSDKHAGQPSRRVAVERGGWLRVGATRRSAMSAVDSVFGGNAGATERASCQSPVPPNRDR